MSKSLTIKNIISEIEKFAPLSYQESYDNAGLIIGDKNSTCQAVLLTIDTTEEVVDEAIKTGANLIISHHPIVFSGLKKITGKNYIERTIIKAIKNDIAIYAAHTNMDNMYLGVNAKIADKIGLLNSTVLAPIVGNLKKLVTFIPTEHTEKVREAVFNAGAGHIGNYDSCSYNLQGKGSFRAPDAATPFVGVKGEIHFEEETRFETVFPAHLQSKIISALLKAHPYEEVAYDIYPLDNEHSLIGAGLIGELPIETSEQEFLLKLKDVFKVSTIRHTPFLNRKIKKVALCGGSGSFLLKTAIRKKADIFISGDFKYHQFFDAENQILIADVGHFESEQYTKELFYDILTKKFPNFAFHFSEVNTNPVNYF
jgi:dinuclear metal center YbgI/SA1388 family protein